MQFVYVKMSFYLITRLTYIIRVWRDEKMILNRRNLIRYFPASINVKVYRYHRNHHSVYMSRIQVLGWLQLRDNEYWRSPQAPPLHSY